MNIFIAVPTYENIYPDTFKSIYGLDTGEHDAAFDFIRGYDVARARNKIAQQTIDEEFDYVLMVDNDVVLPEDALINLLDDAKDVCLGYYAHRDAETNLYTGNTCVCKKGYLNYPLESQFTAQDMLDLQKQRKYKVEIHGGGMGCALIKTDVFKQIQYPWFKWENYPGKVGNRPVLSEDLYFCEQLHKARIPIYTDSRVGCGHLLRRVQWPVPIGE